MIRTDCLASSIILMLGASPALAVPNVIGYSGRLLDANGAALSGEVDIAVAIYDSSTDEIAPLFEETHDAVPLSDGYFFVLINSEANRADFDQLFVLHDALYLAFTVDGETLTPRQTMTAAPWAMAGSAPGQAKLPAGCATGAALQWDSNSSSWTCGNAANASVSISAGEGLLGGGDSDAVSLSVAFAGTGSASSVARSDHEHDTRYYSKAELAGSGTSSINWNNVSNVPPGFSDGFDDVGVTSITGNAPLSASCSAGACAVTLDSSGLSPIGHDHSGAYLARNQAEATAAAVSYCHPLMDSDFSGDNGTLRVVNADASTASCTAATRYKHALVGASIGGGAVKVGVTGAAAGMGLSNYGVLGSSGDATDNNYGVYGSASGATTNYGVRGSAFGTGAETQYGLYGSSSGGTLASYGVRGSATGSVSDNQFGVYGSVSGQGATLSAAIYGQAPTSPATSHAGYFNGNVSTTGDYRFTTPRTSYVNVASVSCHGAGTIGQDSFMRLSTGHVYKEGDSTFSGGLMCPVQLPHGARLTHLSCWVLDNHSTYWLRASLYQQPNGAVASALGTVTTQGIANYATVYEIGADFPADTMVDNSQNAYFLVWSFTSESTNTVRAYNCRVTYSTTTLQP